MTAKDKVARAAASTDIATGAGSGGHSQSRCRQKDDYMENQRKNGKGNPNGAYEHTTNSVEDNRNQLEHLPLFPGTPCFDEPVRGTARTRRGMGRWRMTQSILQD